MNYGPTPKKHSTKIFTNYDYFFSINIIHIKISNIKWIFIIQKKINKFFSPKKEMLNNFLTLGYKENFTAIKHMTIYDIEKHT